MKTIMTLVLFMFMSSAVFAGTKFTPEAFEAAQKKGESIILDFYAPWCPTCRMQEQSFKELEGKGLLKGITHFTVDYDKEQKVKQELKVPNQGMLLAFKGTKEVSRVNGSASIEAIKAFLENSFKQK